MKAFLDDNFLLQNSVAEQLYHEYAADLPIIDYHNHLSPKEIAENKQFKNLTEAWLEGDHYKWRAMRANGIEEKYITGSASDREKFDRWAFTVPSTLRNPLYHWTHLELQRYFQIDDLLSPKSADYVYHRTREELQAPSHSTQGLLAGRKVEVICTTDLPTDLLQYHQLHRNSGSDILMLPTFRPDDFLVIGAEQFPMQLKKLEEIEGACIHTFDHLLAALENRIDYFASMGCRLSDHGLLSLYPTGSATECLDSMMRRRRSGKGVSPAEARQFQMAMLHELGKMYAKRNWTMQLHLGPMRNLNGKLLRGRGPNVGCDSIGDAPQAEGLASFLDGLDRINHLPKTILYNVNPRDNEVFATMAGNFNDGSIPGKVQWGSAWWFLDQKNGMEQQLNVLSNMGLLSRFVGMLTDSRSFLSFPRHEYFRRILCNLLGQDVEQGLLPNDRKLLGDLVAKVCYHNAQSFFNFQRESSLV